MTHLGLDKLKTHQYLLLKVVSVELKRFLHVIQTVKIRLDSILCRLQSILYPRVKLFSAFLSCLLKREYGVTFMAVGNYTINA